MLFTIKKKKKKGILYVGENAIEKGSALHNCQ